MPRKVAKIPESAKQVPTKKQPLRVSAYCRVSTKHEEQQHSLATQISCYIWWSMLINLSLPGRYSSWYKE